MTRTILFALAVALTSISAPAVAQRTERPGPPTFVETGPPPCAQQPAVLFTSPLIGNLHHCLVLNTTSQAVEVSIALISSNGLSTGNDFETSIDPGHIVGTAAGEGGVLYCRITVGGAKEAVRGVLYALSSQGDSATSSEAR